MESGYYAFKTGSSAPFPPSERMRIQSDGNVGIGVTGPTAKLTLADHTTAAGGIKFRTAASAVSLYSKSSGNLNSVGSFNSGSRFRVLGGNGVGDPDYGFRYEDGYGMGFSRAGADIIFVTDSTEQMRLDDDGNVGIGVTSPNAKLHVNGSVHFGTDSAVINPTSGQLLLETTAGNSTSLLMYTYGSSIFQIQSQGTTAQIGWASSQPRTVNFTNSGAGGIKVGIATGAPTQPLDVNGYSICDRQYQRDNSTTVILGTPRILNISYQGSSGTYDFNPVTLFGNLPQGGQCEIQVTGWQNKVNNGFIYWRDNGSNTNIGNGIVGFVQTAVVGSGVISVSTNAGGNVITITFTGWHSNAHGWNAKIISNNS